MTAPLVRPIGPDEVDLFLSFTDASPLGLKPPREMYLDGLGRSYRPEWSWVALRDGRVVARVAFMGPSNADRPEVMGSLEIGTGPDRIAVGSRLVRAAYAGMAGSEGHRLRHIQFVPVDWHERADCRAVVQDRLAVARAAGLELLAERVQLVLDAATPLPDRARRLSFRPPPDDAAVRDVVRRTFAGTRDAQLRRNVEIQGPEPATRSFMAGFGESPALWRLGYDETGACVGIAVPDLGEGGWGPDVAYVGVLPEHRGRGYAEDLLAEASRLLAAAGAAEISAAADAANTPMTAAFARCGYRIVDRLLVCV
jgi:ribosomal protein S18 acetylase RimI-like enzyme